MILPCPFPFSLYDGSIYFHTIFFVASGRNAFAIPASRPVCIGSPVPNSPQKFHFRGMLCAKITARALKIFSASPLWIANRSCFHSGGCFFFFPFPSSADSLCFSALFSFVFSSGAFSGSVSSARIISALWAAAGRSSSAKRSSSIFSSASAVLSRFFPGSSIVFL